MKLSRAQILALKRQHLQMLISLQRGHLGVQVAQAFGPAVNALDKAQVAGRWLRQHPTLLVVGAVALLVWRPRQLLQLAGKGLWLLQMVQKVQPLLGRQDGFNADRRL